MNPQTSPQQLPSTERYRVVAVEPDERYRTRLTIQLAGLAPAPWESLEALVEHLDEEQPTVVVFGPGLANDTGLAHAQRLTRSHPEVGIVLFAEELTLPLLQQALRSGVRDAVTLEADDATGGELHDGLVDRRQAARPDDVADRDGDAAARQNERAEQFFEWQSTDVRNRHW